MELCVETRLGGHTERTKKDMLPYGWGVAFFTHFALKDRSAFISLFFLCVFVLSSFVYCFLVSLLTVLSCCFCFVSHFIFSVCVFSGFLSGLYRDDFQGTRPWRYILTYPRFARYRKFGLGLTIEHLAGKISTFKSFFKTYVRIWGEFLLLLSFLYKAIPPFPSSQEDSGDFLAPQCPRPRPGRGPANVRMMSQFFVDQLPLHLSGPLANPLATGPMVSPV